MVCFSKKMNKIIDKIKWLGYLPLWLIIMLGLFGLSLFEYLWVAIKKRKIVRKIIFSNFIQDWKEKVTGRAKNNCKVI